jgi:hypothetical protein
MTALPSLVSAEGEIVQALTAENLLHAAGITDPRTATIADLAAFVPDADHLTSLAREAKGIVSDELVRRMDRVGKWTLREGDLTIKSSSPAAGTERYDNERLANALTALVGEDVIDAQAAIAAIERVYPRAPEPYWKQKPAGIKALLKLSPRVVEAVLSARVEVDPPRRSVEVTRS